jgi:hypothetical protein
MEQNLNKIMIAVFCTLTVISIIIEQLFGA